MTPAILTLCLRLRPSPALACQCIPGCSSPTTRTRASCAILQTCVTAIGAGQRPVLARNNLLDVFGCKCLQSLGVAAAHRGEKFLHHL
jgi:hypothetical protein